MATQYSKARAVVKFSKLRANIYFGICKLINSKGYTKLQIQSLNSKWTPPRRRRESLLQPPLQYIINCLPPLEYGLNFWVRNVRLTRNNIEIRKGSRICHTSRFSFLFLSTKIHQTHAPNRGRIFTKEHLDLSVGWGLFSQKHAWYGWEKSYKLLKCPNPTFQEQSTRQDLQ